MSRQGTQGVDSALDQLAHRAGGGAFTRSKTIAPGAMLPQAPSRAGSVWEPRPRGDAALSQQPHATQGQTAIPWLAQHPVRLVQGGLL